VDNFTGDVVLAKSGSDESSRATFLHFLGITFTYFEVLLHVVWPKLHKDIKSACILCQITRELYRCAQNDMFSCMF
jgi:hypothetical protein